MNDRRYQDDLGYDDDEEDFPADLDAYEIKKLRRRLGLDDDMLVMAKKVGNNDNSEKS